MTIQPCVSIIMPAFNCERYVGHAIASALGQTHRDLEVIVMDDGSHDDTLAIARRYGEADARVRVFAQNPSGRPGAARNAGLLHARGEYISFLDADDWYHPSRIEHCLAVFEQSPDTTVLFHDMWYTDEIGSLGCSYLSDEHFLERAGAHMDDLGGHRYRCRASFYEFMSTNFAGMHTNTIMLRRAALKEMTTVFPEDVAIGEDTDLWFRLALTFRVAYLDEKLSYYRQHGTGVTSNRERWFRDLLVVHTRNYARGNRLLSLSGRRQYRSRIASMYLSQGYMYWTNDDFPSARKAYRQSFYWSPSIKTFKAQAKALLPSSIARLLRRHVGASA